MQAYYGYTLSPNQIETNDGFLICRNVPIARTGVQDYAGSEIGLDSAEIVHVDRPADEVFSDAALASFEGKPVTDEHPPQLLSPETATLYEKGHAQNIRRGTGEWDGYVIADLHIHDRDLIDKIQNGKREISCGYECEYAQDAQGRYSQHNIRGNHIAVVDRGRAGKRAAILDSDKKTQAQTAPERKPMKKNSILLKLFGQAANGKSEEEITRLAMDAADALEAEATGAKEPEKTTDEPYKEKLFESIDDEMMDGLLEKLMARMAAKKAAEKAMEEDNDPLSEEIKKLTGGEAEVQPGGGSVDREEARVVPAGEMDKGAACGMDKALAASILKAMRPTVAAIKDEKQRRAVSDALIKCVSVKDAANDIAKIVQAAHDNAKHIAEPPQEMNLDEVQAAYDKLNPHRNGGKK